MTATLIELVPRRVHNGRARPARYLRCFNYPGLLTGKKVTLGVTDNPANAETYTDAAHLESALLLLASLGYDDVRTYAITPCYVCNYGPHAPTDGHVYTTETEAAAWFDQTPAEADAAWASAYNGASLRAEAGLPLGRD